ncbi:hypothetical protein HDU92_002646 [Lobulomyces angularis]|nr:hypothetical protein HDU92_002646 [Lobulomyces angularis]
MFDCCNVKIQGLHELLAHYEQAHSSLKRPSSPTNVNVTHHQQSHASSFEDLCLKAFRAPQLLERKNFLVPMEDICKRAVVDLTDPDLTDIEDDLDLYSSDDNSADQTNPRRNGTGTSSSRSSSNDTVLPSSYSDPIVTGFADRITYKRRQNRNSTTKKRTRNEQQRSIQNAKVPKINIINIIDDIDESTDEVDIDILTVDDDDSTLINQVTQLSILPISPPTSENECDDVEDLKKVRKGDILLDEKDDDNDHGSVTSQDDLQEILQDSTTNLLDTDQNSQGQQNQKVPRQSSLSILDPETGERKYICAVTTCKKQYKNANGLKYHLSHAHPNGEGVPQEYLLFQKKKEEEGYRPYKCTVDGCQKRYKNLNGLKYHIEHTHVHLLPPSHHSSSFSSSFAMPPNGINYNNQMQQQAGRQQVNLHHHAFPQQIPMGYPSLFPMYPVVNIN